MSVALPLPLSCARDLYEKLQRDADLLVEKVTTDRFFNFVITSYSLVDWTKADSTFCTIDPRDLYQNNWIKICGDIATAIKHFNITSRPLITRSLSASQGYGVGRFGVGLYGVGEESVHVELNDGTVVACLDFVREVMNAWRNFGF